MFKTLCVVVSTAWAASFCIGAATMSGVFQAGMHALTRISSAITEPVGLVLLGVLLIGLSFLVRRRMHSNKRR